MAQTSFQAIYRAAGVIKKITEHSLIPPLIPHVAEKVVFITEDHDLTHDAKYRVMMTTHYVGENDDKHSIVIELESLDEDRFERRKQSQS